METPPAMPPTLGKTNSFQMTDLVANLPLGGQKRRRSSNFSNGSISAEDAKMLAEELGAPPPQPPASGRQNSLLMPGEGSGMARQLSEFRGFDDPPPASSPGLSRELSESGKSLLQNMSMMRPEKKKIKHRRSRSDSSLQKQDSIGDFAEFNTLPATAPLFSKKSSIDFGLSMDTTLADGAPPQVPAFSKDMSLDLGGVMDEPPAQPPQLGRGSSMSLDLGGILAGDGIELDPPPAENPSFGKAQSSFDLGSFFTGDKLGRQSSLLGGRQSSSLMVRGISMDLGEAPGSLPLMSEQSMDAIASMSDLVDLGPPPAGSPGFSKQLSEQGRSLLLSRLGDLSPLSTPTPTPKEGRKQGGKGKLGRKTGAGAAKASAKAKIHKTGRAPAASKPGGHRRSRSEGSKPRARSKAKKAPEDVITVIDPLTGRLVVKRGPRGKYLCGKCGQKKEGHVCPIVDVRSVASGTEPELTGGGDYRGLKGIQSYNRIASMPTSTVKTVSTHIWNPQQGGHGGGINMGMGMGMGMAMGMGMGMSMGM